MKRLLYRAVFGLLFSSLMLFGSDGRSVKDFIDKEVSIKTVPERVAITCYGGAVQEIAMFLDADSIIAHPGAERFKFFEKLYPSLLKKESVGTFSDINFETLLRIKPDIVFAGVISTQVNDRIKALGIPVYTMGIGKHGLESLFEEFLNVGRLLSNEQKAKELVLYWHHKLKYIARQISKQKEKPKVLYLNASNGFSSENKDWWGDVFISKSGGINIAKNMPVKGAISAETIHIWNPAVIVTPKNRSFKTSTKELLNTPLLKNVLAVKNRAVHTAPIGGFWWDRPSPEAILGILWLSKILYPHEMKNLDLKEESKFFYAKFYDYKLTDSEYESFF